MNKKVKCYICNKELTSLGWNSHWRHKHNDIELETYRDNLFNINPKDKICNNSNCNNTTKWIGSEKRYSQYCSVKCSSSCKLTQKKSKETKTF